MQLAQLKTPALILDRAILERNCKAMAARMKKHGVALRPHMKTAKSARVAALATEGQAGGLCVSTVAEAAYFARHGFRDITYAFGIVPAKLDDLARLAGEGVRIVLLVDDGPNAQAVAARAEALGVTFDVQIEIDSGQHRAGLPPDSPDVVALGRVIRSTRALRLAGVLTHGGHSYDCRSADECRIAAEEERVAVTTAAALLREAGLPCPHVSPGATPTAVHAATLEGATEMRPGNYMFFDLHQAGTGACTPAEIAVSVLASVVGHNRAYNRILLDSGALALSKDIGANAALPNTGYGWVYDMEGRHRLGDLRVARVSQEHGTIESDAPLPFDRLSIASKVRVFPNHSCLMAAAYGHYDVVEGTKIIDRWDRMNGWSV